MELTSDLSTFSVLVFGFLLGLKHATEADHLAAVSTIVSEKKNLFASSIVGGLWGIGHTISLLVVGLIVIFLKLQISEQLEAKLEAGVGVMLVLLGLNALRNLYLTKDAHLHTHEHEGHKHLHTHTHSEKTEEKWHHNLSPRSVVIGMIHGLAGSAALMLLIVPNIKSSFIAVLYILIFGVGSIGGMMLMSFIVGLPFHFTANNLVSFNKVIRFIAAVFSFGLGLSIIYEKLFAA
jgi:high-affinity nickel permease